MTRRQLLAALVFMALGLLVAGAGTARRIWTDSQYREVMLLVDWHALNALPPVASSGQDARVGSDQVIASLLTKLPGARMCYGEETVGTLLAQGIFRRTGSITGAPAYEVTSSRYARDIELGAARHGYWLDSSGAATIVQLPELPEEDLMLLPVAWLTETQERIRALAGEPVLRPGGSEFLAADGLERTLRYLSGQDFVLFQGPTVLGYPSALAETARLLGKQQMYFGWVEFDEQDGGGSLAARLAPNVLRVHSIPPEEMVNYNTAGAAARMLRAVRERNIRCLYIRPFVRGGAALPSGAESGAGYRQQLLETNQKYFAALSDQLKAAGFGVMGKISYLGGPPSSPRDAPDWLKRARPLLVLAIGAAAVMLLALWLPGWPKWAWTLLLSLTVLKALLVYVEPLLLDAVMFGAAVIFPLLGFWLALWVYKELVARWQLAGHDLRRLLLAILALLVASTASMAGGLIIHAGLWDAATMLKVGQFRGVTLSLAVPVLVLAAYCWQGETLADAYDSVCRRLQGFWQRFMLLWNAPIRYGDVAFILIALGAIGVVLLRSGNDSLLGVLSVETYFREGLEQLFYVRPRTKELLGHPLLIVFFLSLPWRNRLSLLLALGGILGQVSILNTFCHLHTPLELTITRVLLGLGLGIASGVLWGVVVLLLWWIKRAVARRLSERAQQSG